MDGYTKLLDAFGAIFKQATGREIEMSLADDKGRLCIAWLVSEDDLQGDIGGVQHLNQEVELLPVALAAG